ncbi:MAG: hypothetical protein K8R74_16900, partial [Bacteroidales bacterium]|nr:hypothetical protein [Bacteroidales bacterium]
TSGITQTTAVLDWIENGTASNWEVEWMIFGTPQGSGTTITGITSHPYTLNPPLSASTTYDWYVRADCGGGDYSDWIGPISFTTLCNPFTAPFSENFDVGVTPPDLPTCWSYLEISASTFGYVSTSTTSSYSAPNNVRMYKVDAADDLLLITPQLGDLTSQSNQIRFMGRASGWAQDLIIGTMSDPTDETTFTAFQTIPITIFNVYEEYTVVFDETYTLTDEYIAFKHGADINYSYLNIDDFVYEAISPPPTSATWVGNAKSNDWHDAGNWDTGVPGSITDVTIPAGLTTYPTINAAAACNDIFLGSDAAGTATLLDNGYLTINGIATVERYFSGNDLDWHLVSAPISDATANVFFDMYLQSFAELTNSYTEITDETTPLNFMEGYGLYSNLAATNTVSFTGTLNFAPQNHGFTAGGAGWNLMGNPYVSSIDWDLVTIPAGMGTEVHFIGFHR